VNEDKKNPRHPAIPESLPDSELEDVRRGVEPEMHRPKPGPDALAAALEAVQRFAAEVDAEQASNGAAEELADNSATIVCRACGYRNRRGNKFCGMCGVVVAQSEEAESQERAEEKRLPSRALDLSPDLFSDHEPLPERGAKSHQAQETHHYHHHYHHHYFPGGAEAAGARSGGDTGRVDSARVDPARELRPTAALRGDMSRAEAAVRRITHEWVLACNTKHLDDLLDLYVPDALVLRSNCPPIRGAAAVREFFFGTLDAGLGEVEVEPLRVEVVGDLAYEAGRCKALIPSATGKRREERGKYLWVFARQSNSEWKLAADCWSSDLTLSVLESDVPQSAGVRTSQPRKGL
jgi:ketosteroid isomerase-like protein